MQKKLPNFKIVDRLIFNNLIVAVVTDARQNISRRDYWFDFQKILQTFVISMTMSYFIFIQSRQIIKE